MSLQSSRVGVGLRAVTTRSIFPSALYVLTKTEQTVNVYRGRLVDKPTLKRVAARWSLHRACVTPIVCVQRLSLVQIEDDRSCRARRNDAYFRPDK